MRITWSGDYKEKTIEVSDVNGIDSMRIQTWTLNDLRHFLATINGDVHGIDFIKLTEIMEFFYDDSKYSLMNLIKGDFHLDVKLKLLI